MRKFSAQRFGRRLEQERKRAGLDLKVFQERLRTEAPRVRGTSWGAVWGYEKGKAPADGPRPEVVQAMAKIFGVRAEYLLYGGPRTELDREAEARAGPHKPSPEVRAFQASDKIVGEAFQLGSAAHVQLWRVLSAITSRKASGGIDFHLWDPDSGDAAANAKRLVRALRAPLNELGLFGRTSEERQYVLREAGNPALDSYIIIACEALLVALAHDVPSLMDGNSGHPEKNDGEA